MNSNNYQSRNSNPILSRIPLQRGLAFGIIIIAALLAFELFNYSTTEFALSDLLGDRSFLGISWATILALAFSGIDFAGIARLFTPEAVDGESQHNEVWYLFGAWLLAATMNAMLTWWGVSLAVLNHQTLGNTMVERNVLLRVVPIFVAVLVWLIRVLIIGTFSVAGERMFTMEGVYIAPKPRAVPASPALGMGRQKPANQLPAHTTSSRRIPAASTPAAIAANSFRPAPKPGREAENNPVGNPRPELTYQTLMNASPSNTPGANAPASRNITENYSSRNTQTRR